MLTDKLPSTLMHVVIMPLLKCKSKDNQIGTADNQFGFKQAHGTEMAILPLKQTEDFLP